MRMHPNNSSFQIRLTYTWYMREKQSGCCVYDINSHCIPVSVAVAFKLCVILRGSDLVGRKLDLPAHKLPQHARIAIKTSRVHKSLPKKKFRHTSASRRDEKSRRMVMMMLFSLTAKATNRDDPPLELYDKLNTR